MKNFKGIIIFVSLILAVLIVFNLFTFVTEQGQYAIVRHLSEIKEVYESPGLRFKVPFLQSVEYMSAKALYYDIPRSDVLTSDKKAFVVNTYMVWEITDPTVFIRSIGTIEAMENRLNAAVYNATKNTLGQYQQNVLFGLLTEDEVEGETLNAAEKAVINRARDNINTTLTQKVNAAVQLYGVNIIDVEIKFLDVPDENRAAIYTRMMAERDQIAKSFTADGAFEAARITNETNRDQDIIIGAANGEADRIRGEAEAEYMKILSDAYNGTEKEEFYKFVRSLDALEKTFGPDNGQKRTIILDQNSDLVKTLLGQ